jgi:hypothetical protein
MSLVASEEEGNSMLVKHLRDVGDTKNLVIMKTNVSRRSFQGPNVNSGGQKEFN